MENVISFEFNLPQPDKKIEENMKNEKKESRKSKILNFSKNHRNQYLRPSFYVKLTQHFENETQENWKNILKAEK